jgi:hypothetical protein
MKAWDKLRQALRLDGEDMSWKKILLLVVLFCGLLFAWINRYELKTVDGKWGAYRLDRWTGATRVISNNRQTDVDYELPRPEAGISHTTAGPRPECASM